LPLLFSVAASRRVTFSFPPGRAPPSSFFNPGTGACVSDRRSPCPPPLFLLFFTAQVFLLLRTNHGRRATASGVGWRRKAPLPLFSFFSSRRASSPFFFLRGHSPGRPETQGVFGTATSARCLPFPSPFFFFFFPFLTSDLREGPFLPFFFFLFFSHCGRSAPRIRRP